LHTNGSLFLIGIGIGLSIAFIGGLVEYWISLRPAVTEEPRRLPSCLLFTTGGLAIAGIAAMIVSIIFNGGVWEALIMGGGVLIGFYAGFLLLFSLWLILNRQ
jgi:hypothetical protein